MNQELANALLPIILLVAMLAVFYFIIIRPQQKKDKAVKKMLAELKVGDRITTIGGIYGRITSIRDDVLTIEVGSDKTKMMIARWAVRSLEETPTGSENDLI